MTRRIRLCALFNGRVERRESIRHVVPLKHLPVGAAEELNMDDELGRSQRHLARGEREPHLSVGTRQRVREDLRLGVP